MFRNAFKVTALSAFIALSTVAIAGRAFASGSHSEGHSEKKEPAKKMDHDAKEKGHGHGGAMAIGMPGKPWEIDRTITVTLMDNFFEPEEIEVKEGETVRFVIINKGEFLHEFNIGTAEMHAEHQKEMEMMAEHGMITATGVDHSKMKMDHGDGKMMMAHDDPNSVLLEPGKASEVIWRFSKMIALEFACNVPGHYDSGMMGPIHIKHGQ